MTFAFLQYDDYKNAWKGKHEYMHHQLVLWAHAGITNFEEVGAADRLTADGVVFLKHKAFSATEIEYCGPDQTIL